MLPSSSGGITRTEFLLDCTKRICWDSKLFKNPLPSHLPKFFLRPITIRTKFPDCNFVYKHTNTQTHTHTHIITIRIRFPGSTCVYTHPSPHQIPRLHYTHKNTHTRPRPRPHTHTHTHTQKHTHTHTHTSIHTRIYPRQIPRRHAGKGREREGARVVLMYMHERAKIIRIQEIILGANLCDIYVVAREEHHALHSHSEKSAP
jgi:hypothetical protein